jgi:methyl-accepting chemotaxis protein
MPTGRRTAAAVSGGFAGAFGALENLPIAAFVLDAERVIRYQNKASVAGIVKLGALLPISPEQVIGMPIDSLAPGAAPEPTAGLTADSVRKLTVVELGPVSLELQAEPIHEADGSFGGAVVTWIDATEKLALQKQNQQIHSMMENSPTNMMFADRDMVIRYMNPKSLETLRSVEQYLPVKADDVVGSSLDIFHKTPSYQRGILNDEKMLPRRANIKLGPETLDLLVSAIRDEKGDYVGAMATWDVVTERLAMEAAAEENAADTVAVNRVLSALQTASSTDEAAQIAVDTVRDAFGWAYASYWAVEDDAALHFRLESGDAGEEFRKVTLAASFREGVGLSGRAWKTRDLFFTRDIGEMTDCVRAPIAQKVGVKSGVCFPIMVRGEVVGTMDFFATETLNPSEQRLEALRNVGRLVSAAMDRIEKETSDRAAAEELRHKVDMVLDVVSAAAAGDLTREMPVRGTDAIGRLGEGLEAFLSTLRTSMSEIGGNAEAVAASAEELTNVSSAMGQSASQSSDRAGTASAASEQISASIQTVATAAEEMTASIREIAKNAADAATVATTAVTVAGGAKTTVASLGESSAEIGKVIKTITSIAQQTNLLALNATIEAARAGEAGKGFAVVANEVKELAKETARATEDISAKIEAIQAGTQGAVDAITEIGDIIDRINDIQTTIASAVEEQTATTNEIARNVAEAATGADGIAADIAQVAEAARSTQQGSEETMGSATSLAGSAIELKRLLGQFHY